MKKLGALVIISTLGGHCLPAHADGANFLSLNVTFTYSELGPGKTLPQANNSRSVLRTIFSKAHDVRDIRDNFFAGAAKDAVTLRARFIEELAKSVQGHEIVNFNYIGHGLKGTDGRWYLVLPVSGGGDRAHLVPQVSATGVIEAVRNRSDWQEAIELLDVSKPQATDGTISFDEILRVLSEAGVKRVFGVLEAEFTEKCADLKSPPPELLYSFIYSAGQNEISHEGLLTGIHLANKRRLNSDADLVLTWGEMRRGSQGRLSHGRKTGMIGSFGQPDPYLDNLTISDAI